MPYNSYDPHYVQTQRKVRMSLSPENRHSVQINRSKQQIKSQQEHLSDYYTLRKVKKTTKNKKKPTKSLSVASLQQHTATLQKLHIIVDSRNKHHINLINQCAKLKNQNTMLRMQIQQTHNQKQKQYIKQLKDKQAQLQKIRSIYSEQQEQSIKNIDKLKKRRDKLAEEIKSIDNNNKYKKLYL